MNDASREQNQPSQDSQRADARVLGQILAAQNFLFVLPDEARIAEFFSQALGQVPGVTSCFVCLGDLPVPVGASSEVCRECVTERKKVGETLVMPSNFSCGWAARQDLRVIPLRTTEHTFGFFIFRTDGSGVIEPYWPFLNNLANYVALSLENRMQRLDLEKARDELEDRVKKRTAELGILNAHIRKLNQELEQRVHDRTAQLEAANKELEAFAYSVSHDLRAPLRHIDGFLELLQGRTAITLDEQSQHYMANISDSAKRMGTLIDDLLSFSRLGRYEISKLWVDLGELTQEVIREFEPETGGRNIHWQIGNLPMVTGDRAMLRVVLVNLISNALKFTQPREQAEIEIGCQSQKTETIIFVRDNGVGFDPRYADKLFGVFQRLHRADEFEGTGIGLANVRRIINRHGGRTWAKGEVNLGATFYFSLPQTIQGG